MDFIRQKYQLLINSSALARLKSWLKARLEILPQKQIKQLIDHPKFPVAFAVFSVLVLGGSVLFWTILGARLHSANADQLLGPYLFSGNHVFHDATWPVSHTFLIKWPFFLLIKAFGFSSLVFCIITIVLVMATVAGLVGIIYKIERRPLYFGALCLALASVLMLVPAQPYFGALLPVNMAMVATRNLEYVLYIAAVFIVVRSPKLRSVGFWIGVLLLGLLIASDRLFLMLTIGGALIALVVYALSSGWNMVSLTVRWLVAGLLAGGIGLAILWSLNSLGITHISSQAAGGPYDLITSFHKLALGIIYGILGFFSNFGADPASGTTILGDVPRDSLSHLLGISGLAYVINILILGGCLFAGWKLIKTSLDHNKNHKVQLNTITRSSIILLWTSLAAVVIFAISDHYYAVDARYLTIALFGLFISLAIYLSGKQLRDKTIYLSASVIILGILLAIPAVVRAYRNGQAAFSPMTQRNSLIVTALKHHPVNLLVGDYWRVIPTKSVSGNKLSVMPLAGCTRPADTLSSRSWQPDLSKHSFAYLLTLEGNLTNYPSCTLGQVTAAYGKPNASILVAGNYSHPKEMLLFYDRGAHKSSPNAAITTSSTVVPITFDDLPHTYCSVPTIMNIVAHEDDDLLFMNPDTLHDIKAGHCVRTVYLTAGDSGGDQFYWLSRQQGSEAAYGSMVGSDDVWIERIVKLSDKQFITVANPRGNNYVSLIFLHLPDGNLKGQGFAVSNFESLAKLDYGAMSSLQSIDDQSQYSSSDLSSALAMLMHAYQPAEIRTQSALPGHYFPDHSDHLAVSRIVKKAHNRYEKQQYEDRLVIPLKFYLGYPVHERPPNVEGDDLAQKEALFNTYSKYDGGVCQSLQRCISDPAYGAYLKRQYQNDY